MKSIRKSFIFAFVFGTVLMLAPERGFAKTSSDKGKSTSEALVRGSEKQFVAYIKSEFPAFAQHERWGVIEKMVTLYNEQPSALRGVKPQEREAFNEAVQELNGQLASRNTAEAQQWLLNLDKTAKAIRFVWNFDLNSLTPIVTEVAPMPGSVTGSNL